MTTDNILSRIGRVMSGMAHAAVDAAEQLSPEATLEQAIREIDGAADELRGALGKVMAEKHRVSARIKELEMERTDLDEKVAKAVSSSRDDLAEAGIARQIDIESQTALLGRVLGDCEERIGQFETTLEAIRASRREAEARLRDLRQSREAVAADSVGGRAGGGIGSAQAKVERAEAVAARLTGVATGPKPENPAVLEELHRMHRKNQISERLARLKANRD